MITLPARISLRAPSGWRLHLVVLLTVCAVEVFGPATPIDLAVYMNGGQEVLQRHDYLYGPHPDWSLPFTYPPFAALCFAIFAELPGVATKLLFILMSAMALARLIVLVIRKSEPEASEPCPAWVAVTALVASALLEPVWQTLAFGQVNLILAWLVAEDLLGRSRRRTRGVGIGIAAGIKLIPGIFLLYLLVTKQWRAAIIGGATAFATVVVGWVSLPNSSWDYWTRAVLDPSRVGGPGFVSNQSLYGVIWRFTNGYGSPLLWASSALATFLVCGLVAVKAHRLGSEAIAVLVAALCGLLVSPISWSYHWVWVAPLSLVLILLGWRASGAARWAAYVVSACWLFVCWTWALWWQPFGDSREYAISWSGKVLDAIYAILAYCTIIAFALILRDVQDSVSSQDAKGQRRFITGAVGS